MLINVLLTHLAYAYSSLSLRRLACSLFVLIAVTPALAATWQDEFSQTKLLGQGEFTWFGLSIYRARLWSEHPRFDRKRHFALELTYQRSLSGRRIAETGIKEIKRIYGRQITDERLDLWLTVLTKAIPNVKDGSKLIAVYEPNQGMKIYNAQQLLADIPDPELAEAFFAIWLDERTKDQVLRAQLLGSDL